MKKFLLLIPIIVQAQNVQNVIFIGSEATASTTPKPQGLTAVALSIGQSTWSYSMYNVYFINGKPITATSTGLAKELWCKTLGKLSTCIIGLGTVGAATNSSSSTTTASFNAGGGVNIKGVFRPSISIFLGVFQAKAGSSTAPLVTIAIGKNF